MNNNKTEYWLVSINESKAIFSLVKLSGKAAEVIAGDNRGTQGFRNGKPDTILKPNWVFELLANKPTTTLTDLSEWIDALGVITTSETRLKKTHKRMNAIERSRSLTEEDIHKIKEMKANGVSRRRIAAKFSVSDSFVQRLKD